jgi:hypothetical protein
LTYRWRQVQRQRAIVQPLIGEDIPSQARRYFVHGRVGGRHEVDQEGDRPAVHNWIGVDNGYLGSFSYAKHDRFWMEACDLHVDTSAFAGTTRACFEETLFAASARDQAAALRSLLDDCPVARRSVDTDLRQQG